MKGWKEAELLQLIRPSLHLGPPSRQGRQVVKATSLIWSSLIQ
jgi:hypothetical protein